ncbi:hypothetical protein RRG08_002291 [Elysia crispata]|uniref:HP domain-containing protein n=1 Tax=Elysia crispata TaxID=231223 RepID=A0AAE0ZAU9_9GAST|nr:hypothetical protein RRG08_002291 [Elysia crispata]
MGAKPGKHARNPSAGGDGSPLAKRSPKGKPSKGSEVASSPEHSLVHTGAGGAGDAGSSDQPYQPDITDDANSSEKENIVGFSSSSSSLKGGGKKSIRAEDDRSSPGVDRTKSPVQNGQLEEEVEETIVASQQSSVRMEPQQQQQLEPLTPLVINENQDISIPTQRHGRHHPQATSTPAANGQFRTPPLSPDSGTDQSDDEAFSPGDQLQLYSPTVSFNSTSLGSSSWSRPLSDSVENRRTEPNFGRFYNQSYLGLEKPKRSASESKAKGSPSSHFHRPENFTYAKDPPTFLKKKASGMSALASGKRVVKKRQGASPVNLRNQEAVRMSMFPSAKPKKPDEMDKIERDDWPAPASPAALLPEILRQRRKSRGEDDEEDEDEKPKEDPRIKRELEEISKIKDESGIGSVIYKELDRLKARPLAPLDPWKASRAPSAKFEPRYRTRYQSPMFASPSRFLDRPRYAWDDSDIRAYRSVSTLANLPTPKPGYGPSYITPRAATLPLAGAYGARVDFRYFDFGEDDRPERSTNASSSTLTGDTSSRRQDTSYTGYDGPTIPLLQLQKSTWHTEIEPSIYPYDRLKITNFDLPKDVDINQLEIHLSNQEFENLFNMPREGFHRLPEWKRNDMKRKLHLY